MLVATVAELVADLLLVMLAAQQKHHLVDPLQQLLVCPVWLLSEAACPTCKLLLCHLLGGLHSSR